MNDTSPPPPQGTPTVAQQRMMRAYDNSRRLWDAAKIALATDDMPAPEGGDNVTRAQVRTMRFRRDHRPIIDDAHEAITLVGALARLAGGETLGGQRSGDMGGWILTLVQLGAMAGRNSLAIRPLLNMAELLAGTDDHAVNLMASCLDMSVLATSPVAQETEAIEAERRAWFGALGQVATCAWMCATQRLGPWPAGMNIRTFYVAAVDMTIGGG